MVIYLFSPAGASIIACVTYGSAENVYSLATGKNFAGSNLQGQQKVDAGVDGLVTTGTAGLGAAVKYGLKTLKSGVNLYRSFAKNTAGMFKGVNHNQLRSAAYKDMIKTHNFNVRDARSANLNLRDINTGIDVSESSNSEN